MARKQFKDIAIGATIAAGVGYLAGILTAPKSGKETRKDIASAAAKAKSEAEKRFKQVYSELNTLIEEGKKLALTLNAGAKTDLEAVVDRAAAAKEKVREVLSAIHEGESDDEDLDNALKDVTKALSDLRSFLVKHGKETK